MILIDLMHRLRFVEAIVQTAGQVALTRFHNRDFAVSAKGRQDLVSDVDRATEAVRSPPRLCENSDFENLVRTIISRRGNLRVPSEQNLAMGHIAEHRSVAYAAQTSFHTASALCEGDGNIDVPGPKPPVDAEKCRHESCRSLLAIQISE